MTAVLNIAVPLLASLSIALALLFFYRAWRSKRSHSKAAFGVAQQEARLARRVEFVRGFAAMLVGLILFSVAGLSARPPEESPPTTVQPTAPPTVQEAVTAAATVAPTPAVTEASKESPPLVSPAAPPTSASIDVTETSAPAPATETPTAAPATAVVISEAGVWLRSAPSVEGERLEWVLVGTTLTLLPGTETADDFDWQQVRTPNGNEGWVAVPFIQYSQ